MTILMIKQTKHHTTSPGEWCCRWTTSILCRYWAETYVMHLACVRHLSYPGGFQWLRSVGDRSCCHPHLPAWTCLIHLPHSTHSPTPPAPKIITGEWCCRCQSIFTISYSLNRIKVSHLFIIRAFTLTQRNGNSGDIIRNSFAMGPSNELMQCIFSASPT